MILGTGTKIAGYRVERLLGSGGMGTVYLAIQESLNRPVALKLLSPQLTADETFRARFRREGEVQAALDHPHIVPVYEAGETDDGLFLAMRYVRGSTLKDLVESGELDPARTLRLLAPVAGALDSAHAAGLIHRDVKPQNILVDQTDWPYLADFGLTRGNAGGPTRTGQMVGTFAYIAPEQVKGMKASARSDQYALAAVLFECLAGEMPHNHESDAALLYAKVHEEPPRLSQRTPELPRGFDEVLARGMARDPAERFASATAFLAAATAALERADSAERTTGSATTISAARETLPPREDTPTPHNAPSKSQDTVLVDAEPTPPTPPRPRLPKPAATPWRGLPLGSQVTDTPFFVPVAACVAAAIGFGVTGALAGGDAPSPKRVTAGKVGTVEIPNAMRATRRPAGLGLQSLRAYATGEGAARRTIAVGSGQPAGPNLLPSGGLASAARNGDSPAVARAGAAKSLWYVGLRVPGLSGRTQVLTIPHSGGVLVAACAAPRPRDATCATALGSLTLRRGVRASDVVASTAYVSAIKRRVSAYEKRRAAASALLNRAGRSATQAQAAGRLRDAAGALASTVGRLDPSPGARPAHDDLIASARRLRSAAGRLDTAATKQAPKRYRDAAADTEAADRALRQAVTRLRSTYTTG